jgi:hypothetical protein
LPHAIDAATKHRRDLFKPLRVHFIGEEGIDAGGVKKEFFQLLVGELLSPDYGMLVYQPESNTYWCALAGGCGVSRRAQRCARRSTTLACTTSRGHPDNTATPNTPPPPPGPHAPHTTARAHRFNACSLEGEEQFMLMGLVLGLAIYNRVLLDFPLPLPLYKKLLGQGVGLRDLEEMQPRLGRSLRQLLQYEGPDSVEVRALPAAAGWECVHGRQGHVQMAGRNARLRVPTPPSTPPPPPRAASPPHPPRRAAPAPLARARAGHLLPDLLRGDGLFRGPAHHLAQAGRRQHPRDRGEPARVRAAHGRVPAVALRPAPV